MTTDTVLACAVKKVSDHHGAHPALRGSILCTGVSPWQRASEVMIHRGGDEKALQRLRGHRSTCRRLFWAFESLRKKYYHEM
eukprot:1595776-Pyramimonas_sp.AAC.1